MNLIETFQVIAAAAVLVGGAVVTFPGRAVPFLPWFATGLGAVVMAVDFFQARTDREGEER